MTSLNNDLIFKLYEYRANMLKNAGKKKSELKLSHDKIKKNFSVEFTKEALDLFDHVLEKLVEEMFIRSFYFSDRENVYETDVKNAVLSDTPIYEFLMKCKGMED